MNRHRPSHLVLALLIAVSLTLSCSIRRDLREEVPPFQIPTESVVGETAPHADTLQVGIAQLDISPDHSVILGGYGVYFGSIRNCRWSNGIHDPIYATAMYFLKGSDALVIIQTDLVGLFKTDTDPIRQAVANVLAIDRARVIVASTHTHASPDTAGLWGTTLPANPGRDERFMNSAKEKCVKAAVQAYQNRQPARLYMAIGQESDTHYNTHQDETEDPNLDPTLTVLRADDLQGHTIATLTNWACHPTTENEKNLNISSDWVGAFYQSMAEKSAGIHMYINGSIGASVQPSPAWRDEHIGGEGQGFVWAKAMGEHLANKAGKLLAEMKEIQVDRIEARQATVSFKLDSFLFRLATVLGVLDMGFSEHGQYETDIAAVKIGPLRFGTMPGEMSPHLGKQIRRHLGGDAQVLIGLGQDQLGYILDEEQYENNVYSYERMLCVSPVLGGEVVTAHQRIRFE